MFRVLGFVVGVLLLPFCVTATRAVVCLAFGSASDGGALPSPGALAAAGGFAAWVVLYATLPAPARAYILAHELTHALWGSLLGAEVRDIKVGATSGSVVLSKTNFLITLAPYFFPFYTALVAVAYGVVSLFVDTGRHRVVWMALMGFSWGFHVTFTLAMLLRRQSDIRRCGHVFSYATIYLLNLLGVGLWLVWLSPATWDDFAVRMREAVADGVRIHAGGIGQVTRAARAIKGGAER